MKVNDSEEQRLEKWITNRVRRLNSERTEERQIEKGECKKEGGTVANYESGL